MFVKVTPVFNCFGEEINNGEPVIINFYHCISLKTYQVDDIPGSVKLLCAKMVNGESFFIKEDINNIWAKIR